MADLAAPAIPLGLLRALTVSLAGGSGQPDLTPGGDRDKRNATTMTL